jgi:DNA-nicking Smr family endonuclease
VIEQDECNNVWHEYTAGMRMLKSRPKNLAPVKPKLFVTETHTLALPLTPHKALMPFDKVTFNKIKKGKIAINATLDLHGCFLQEAHQLLNAFVHNQYALGHKLLLVITGKSEKTNGQLTIRASIKDWIENSELLNIVHSVDHAAAIHGGAGAMYLKLRRKT